jgi:TRAP-type C4-dicarboxylate transport system permease small subunit
MSSTKNILVICFITFTFVGSLMAVKETVDRKINNAIITVSAILMFSRPRSQKIDTLCISFITEPLAEIM